MLRGSKILALCGLLMAGQPGLSGTDPAALCDAAALSASRATDVPQDILLAIARAESGRRQDGVLRPWPWTINDGGQGYWYPTEAEALAAAKARLAAGDDNFDLGCFQINTRWHGQAFASLEDMLDPATNAHYAAAFLTELERETGNWDRAIAAYHSRTAELAGPYLDRVTSLRGLQAPSHTSALMAANVSPERPNLFPLLQSGKSGSVGSLVPMQAGLGPLFDDRG